MAWRNLPTAKKKSSQSASKSQPEPLPESAPWTRTHTTEELVDLHTDYYQRRETGKLVAWAVSSARIRDIERELAERGRLDLLTEALGEEEYIEEG